MTGIHEGHHWHHGRWFQYTLNTRGEKAVDLAVTYAGGDAGRNFDILANDTLLTLEELKAEKPDSSSKSAPLSRRKYSLPRRTSA